MTSTLYLWSRGGEPVSLPQDIGFPVGGDTRHQHLVLQVAAVRCVTILSTITAGALHQRGAAGQGGRHQRGGHQLHRHTAPQASEPHKFNPNTKYQTSSHKITPIHNSKDHLTITPHGSVPRSPHNNPPWMCAQITSQ